MPRTVEALITGTGRMADLGTCTLTLTWDRVDGAWHGSTVCCNGFTLTLDCASGPAWRPEDFRLSVLGCTDSYGGDATLNASGAYSRCDPFYLYFGPFAVPGSDLVCQCGTQDPMTMLYPDGEFIVEITE
jgi:hypothetical protein